MMGMIARLTALAQVTAVAAPLAALAASVAHPVISAEAAESVQLPFPAGQRVKIIQGYYGGTHQGVERFSLDLVLIGADTSEAPVLAPVTGRIEWASSPGMGNGCLAIQLGETGPQSVMLCHVILDRPFALREPIAQGQRLGRVGPAGAVGNNGIPHVHLQLYQRVLGVRVPLPFAPPEGRPLAGANLPPESGFNQHGGFDSLISTNGAEVPAPAPAGAEPDRGGPPAPPGGPAPPAAPPPPAAAPPPAAPPPASPAALPPTVPPTGAPPPTAAPPPNAPPPNAPPPPAGQGGPSRRLPAVVEGTELCLNVRPSPSRQAPRTRCLPDGARVTIVDGPVEADGHSWFHLEGLGWAVADYLKPGGEEPPAVPSASTASSGPTASSGSPDAPPAQPTSRRSATVAGTEICLNVRQSPSLQAPRTKCLADGARVTIVEGPVEAEGRRWFHLDVLGWAVSDYLKLDGSVLPMAATTPPAAAPPAAPSQPSAQWQAVVDGTEICLNVRESASLQAPRTRCLADGARVTVVEGPVEGEGRRWVHLEGIGWAVTDYLKPGGG